MDGQRSAAGTVGAGCALGWWRPVHFEHLRSVRLSETLRTKVPKLLQAHSTARTILVLEDRDMHMSAPAFVSQAMQAAVGTGDLPDVIYLLNVTTGSRAVLEGHDLRLVGFVARDDDGTPRLTRFVINCCAADGAAVQAVLISDGGLPEDGTWVEVVGQLSHEGPGAQATDDDGAQPPAILVGSVEEIEEPDLPYEFPYSRIG